MGGVRSQAGHSSSFSSGYSGKHHACRLTASNYSSSPNFKVPRHGFSIAESVHSLECEKTIFNVHFSCSKFGVTVCEHAPETESTHFSFQKRTAKNGLVSKGHRWIDLAFFFPSGAFLVSGDRRLRIRGGRRRWFRRCGRWHIIRVGSSMMRAIFSL